MRLFPFHNGSIETEYFTTADFHYCKFPFHNGSIETKKNSIRYWLGIENFHSTMVRLRPAIRYLVNVLNRDFHSTMVRLRHFKCVQFADAPARYGFPFHNGSIETRSGSGRYNDKGLFPFHNGSIETERKMTWLELITKISIPQWFD